MTEDDLMHFCVQVRKNKFVEILPINVGCLGACTYCKTKHARGHLGSYTVDSLVSTFDCLICSWLEVCVPLTFYHALGTPCENCHI